MINFHQIEEITSNRSKINTAPGTKNMPILEIKNCPTSLIPSLLITPTRRNIKNKIIPINEPGKDTFIRDNK